MGRRHAARAAGADAMRPDPARRHPVLLAACSGTLFPGDWPPGNNGEILYRHGTSNHLKDFARRPLTARHMRPID
jgi:hypothetical protein